MGQIITTQNLVAIKEVRHAGQRNEATRGQPVAHCTTNELLLLAHGRFQHHFPEMYGRVTKVDEDP